MDSTTRIKVDPHSALPRRKFFSLRFLSRHSAVALLRVTLVSVPVTFAEYCFQKIQPSLVYEPPMTGKTTGWHSSPRSSQLLAKSRRKGDTRLC